MYESVGEVILTIFCLLASILVFVLPFKSTKFGRLKYRDLWLQEGTEEADEQEEKLKITVNSTALECPE